LAVYGQGGLFELRGRASAPVDNQAQVVHTMRYTTA